MRDRASHGLLSRYVGREYILSFAVAFLFFFFIFFINQILLLAQKILLKNVDVWSVLHLVVLAIPQFLLYTMPFSSLTAASMVIGDLSSRNEILALRSVGVSIRHVFSPIIVLSLALSLVTFAIADILLPWSAVQYKEMYSSLMRELPTIELQSYAVNTVGDKVIANGLVEGSTVHDIVLFDIKNREDSQVVSAPSGQVELVDIDKFVYRLVLDSPLILSTDVSDIQSWGLADAESATFYLDFSNQIPAMTDMSPSQLSTRDLLSAIQLRQSDLDAEYATIANDLRAIQEERALLQRKLDFPLDGEDPYQIANRLIALEQEAKELAARRPINFYHQYYRAELHKKFALSAACFFLVFIAFPISFFKVKHGRLIGFGLSMLIACTYWFMLFFAQLKIFDISCTPAVLIWAPDAVIFIAGCLLLLRLRRL